MGNIRQARVVRKVDSVIHWINHYLNWIAWFILLLIHWIEIYPVDSIIQSLIN